MGEEVGNMVGEGGIRGKCRVGGGVGEFVVEVGVVVVEEVEESLVVEGDREIGVFEFGGGKIRVGVD